MSNTTSWQTELEDEVSLADLWRIIKKGLLPSLLAAALLAVLIFFASQRLAPTYQAETTLLAKSPSINLSGLSGAVISSPLLSPETYQATVFSQQVLGQLLEAPPASVSRADYQELEDRIDVTVSEDRFSMLIKISAKGDTPERAASLANRVAAVLIAWDRQQASANLNQIIASLEQQLQALQIDISALSTTNPQRLETLETLRAQQRVQLETARMLRNSAVGSLSVLNRALEPIAPVAPRPKLNAALAFVLTLMLGMLITFLREALSSRLRDSEELVTLSQLPLLAEFPKQTKGSRRLPLERISYLRTNVLFTSPKETRIIAVTGPVSGVGKSSVALSLAESFARRGQRTLLLDADLRKPVLAAHYQLEADELVSTQTCLENPQREYRPKRLTDELYLVSGLEAAVSPLELLHHGLKECLARWRQSFDVIIIDTPPIIAVADTLVIVPHVTDVMLLASPQTSDRDQFVKALRILQRVGAPLIGVVATNLQTSTLHHSGYGYGYYGGPKPAARGKLSSPRLGQVDDIGGAPAKVQT